MPITTLMQCFESLAGDLEWFDLEPLRRSDIFCGKWPPHHFTILYAIPGDRWVLGYVDGLNDIDARTGTLIPFQDIEVTPGFVARWLADNGHPWPDSLRGVVARQGGNPYQDLRVQRFYHECEARSRGQFLPTPPAASSESTPTVTPAQDDSPFRVDVEECVIYVDGKAYQLLREPIAVYAEALIKAKGHWVSFPEMVRDHPILEGANQTRLIARLREIPGIRERIQTKPGCGARLR